MEYYGAAPSNNNLFDWYLFHVGIRGQWSTECVALQ